MIRRPLWLGAGIALGVGGTLWAEHRVRRAVEALSPAVAANDALKAAREMGGRVREAVDAARVERSRREVELWRRVGEPPPSRHGREPRRPGAPPSPRGVHRQHR